MNLEISHLHTSKSSYSNGMHPRKILAISVKDSDTGEGSLAELLKTTALSLVLLAKMFGLTDQQKINLVKA